MEVFEKREGSLSGIDSSEVDQVAAQAIPCIHANYKSFVFQVYGKI